MSVFTRSFNSQHGSICSPLAVRANIVNRYVAFRPPRRAEVGVELPILIPGGTSNGAGTGINSHGSTFGAQLARRVRLKPGAPSLAGSPAGPPMPDRRSPYRRRAATGLAASVVGVRAAGASNSAGSTSSAAASRSGTVMVAETSARSIEAIAAQLGVNESTVRRVRGATSAKDEVETRNGRDGKTRVISSTMSAPAAATRQRLRR